MLLHHSYQGCKWVIFCLLKLLSVKIIIVTRWILWRRLCRIRGLHICSFVKSEEKWTALILLWVLPRAFIISFFNALTSFSNVCCDLLARMCEYISLQSHCWTNPFFLLFITWLNKVILVCRGRVLERDTLMLTNVLIIHCTDERFFNLVMVTEVIWGAFKCIDVWHTIRRHSHTWSAPH